jgi:hypothetical protein
VFSQLLQADQLTSSLAPDGLDWDFSKRYPDCKSWLEVISPERVDGYVQHGIRVTQAEWKAGRKERVSKWYKGIAGQGQQAGHAASSLLLTCPILDLWYDSDKDSWPAYMQHFWEDVSFDRMFSIAVNIRHRYADDLKLCEVAEWLMFWQSKRVRVRHNVRAVSVPIAAVHIPNFAAQHCGHKSWLRVVHPPHLLRVVQQGKRISKEEWQSQLNKRINQWYEDLATQHAMPLSYPIPDMWRDADFHSWPNGLADFWLYTSSSNDVAKTVPLLRAEYGNDSDILECANWLEYWNSIEGVQIECYVRE